MRRGLNQVSAISLRRKGLNQVSGISLRRRGLKPSFPSFPEEKGICNSLAQGKGPKFLGVKWLPRENGPSSLGDIWLLGECAQVPQGNMVPHHKWA